MTVFTVATCRCGCTRSGHHYEYARGAMRSMGCKTHRVGAERCVEFAPVDDHVETEGRPADASAAPAVDLAPPPVPAEAAPGPLADELRTAGGDQPEPAGEAPAAIPAQRAVRPPVAVPEHEAGEVLDVWNGWLCQQGRRYRDAGPHGAPEWCGCRLVPITTTITRRST